MYNFNISFLSGGPGGPEGKPEHHMPKHHRPTGQPGGKAEQAVPEDQEDREDVADPVAQVSICCVQY